MAIPTTRTKEKASIKIDELKCSGCGLCVSVCKDYSIIIKNNKVSVSSSPQFGCIGCGHCMAICPNGAIEIFGRELSPADLFELPSESDVTKYEQILNLYNRRRSIREFKDKEIEQEVVDKILNASVTAPMGLPPSDVNVLVIKGFEKTREFAKDFSKYLKGMKFMTSKIFLAVMRPFWGKETDEMFKGFIKPLMDAYTNKMDKGDNYINYDPPLLMYFYGSPYSDPADPIIAATYAMLSAESLGLGTVMLGAVHPFIQSGNKAEKFRKDHKIIYKSKEGLFVAFGYPKVRYKKGIRRTFASVTEI